MNKSQMSKISETVENALSNYEITKNDTSIFDELMKKEKEVKPPLPMKKRKTKKFLKSTFNISVFNKDMDIPSYSLPLRLTLSKQQLGPLKS